MISRIFPIHGILEYQLAGTTDPSDITSLVFIALVRSDNYIPAWVQKISGFNGLECFFINSS